MSARRAVGTQGIAPHLEPPSVHYSKMVIAIFILLAQFFQARFQLRLLPFVVEHLPVYRIFLVALKTQQSACMFGEKVDGAWKGGCSDHSGWEGGECQRVVEGHL